MKKLYIVLFRRLELVIFFLILVGIITTGSGKQTNYASNIGNATSLQAIHFITDPVQEVFNFHAALNFQEVISYGPSRPVSFVGQITAYTGNCPGCSGKVACPPAMDVKENIYYQDSTYGTVRILAADGRIPCGTIIKIVHAPFSDEDIVGIVLDRGGAIVDNIIDLLVENESDGTIIGRQSNIQFQVIRWGW